MRASVVAGEPRRLAALRLGVTVGLSQRQAEAALGLSAHGQADGSSGEQLGGRVQQVVRAARFQLQLCFAQAVLGAACAQDPLVEGQLEAALGRVQLPCGALYDGLEHRFQDRPLHRLLDRAAYAPIGDAAKVRFRPLDPVLRCDGLCCAARACRAGLDRLQPIVAVRAQAEEDAQRLQSIVRSIEVDRVQRARHRLSDGKAAERGMRPHALQLFAGELELELQLTLPGNAHRQLPDATAAPCLGSEQARLAREARVVAVKIEDEVIHRTIAKTRDSPSLAQDKHISSAPSRG